MDDSLSPALGEKRGALTGGAATDEVLASSPSVLAPSRSGRARGLQQFFTPLAVTRFIARVLGHGGQVLDPTAGDGALLSAFDQGARFGCEIDVDQVRAARKLGRPYQALRGDLQHVYPLLRRVGAEFSTVVLNPPFGLEWQVPGLEPSRGSSTLLAFLMTRGLLAYDGQGCLIAGRDRFYREVLAATPEAFFGVVEMERLFSGVDLPCVLAFFVSPERDSPRVTASRVNAQVRSKTGLDDELVVQIESARTHVLPYVGRRADADLPKTLEAVQAECDRRLGKRRAQQKDTLALEGGRLRVRPSAFTMLALSRTPDGNLNRWLEGFDRQPPSYFAMQGKEWRRLLDLDAEGTITIANEVRRAVDAAVADHERVAVPLYELSSVQRLGFLVDLDHLRCCASDPERGFVAGDVYPIDCGTEVLASKATREIETPKGPEAFEVVVEKKAMRITIGTHRFTESAADLEYILGHFDVPDPGEIATRFPDEIARWENILADIEREIQEREPGFRYFWFQPRDLARLLFKGRGLLGWEQGCGKSLGIGSLVRALDKNGDLDDGCALLVMPQDLVQQFVREMQRFFGREVVCIGSAAAPGKLVAGAPSPVPFASSSLWRVGTTERRAPSEWTAVKVREVVRARRQDLAAQRRGVHLAPRPPVWAVTWFEALAITQRIDEHLPAERVLHQIELATDKAGATDVELRKPKRKEVWSSELCPACRADVKGGWNPVSGICSAELARAVDRLHEHDQVSARHNVCGYVHRALRRKPAYAILKDVFNLVIIDEATKIQGESYTSKAIRALRPRYRYVATGTAIKNFIPSAFWLLWWSLGDASARFPYSYRGGKDRFTADFAVIETRLDELGCKAKTAHPKVLPEVSNLLRLWRILCSSVVRRRIDEVGVVVSLEGAWRCHACKTLQRADVGTAGEWRKPARVVCTGCKRAWDTIVPITYVPVDVPWGVAQRRFYINWLSKENFERHFLAKHPESPIPRQMISRLAAGLGQLAKLSYATVDPTSDPDDDFKTPDLSPWTPARLQTLTLAETHVAAGEQVLIASSHVALGPWVAARLQERGLAAGHICDVDGGGRPSTLPPKERAEVMARFKRGGLRVLCVGVQAVNLGHNLDCASVIILDGLPWDFATKDQMVKRVRRLTSRRPVTAYIILPTSSLSTKIWSSLRDKTAASDLALDAKLSSHDEQPIDRTAILRELQEEGAELDGTEVPERHIFALWNGLYATQ